MIRPTGSTPWRRPEHGCVSAWLTQQGLILNIVVGIVGAFIAGLIFTGGTINQAPLSIEAFLVSLVGAVVLLGIVNLLRRGSIR